MSIVLVIGSGGREGAIAWKLAKSEAVLKVYVHPGNPGTWSNTSKVSTPVDVPNISDGYVSLSLWCKNNKVDLVVVGPEDPLAQGICDVLSSHGIKCFGPSKAAAHIESSKTFAKDLMDKYGIPTAAWKSFTDAHQAKEYIRQSSQEKLVVKADGLAAGKGVVVAFSKDEALNAVDDIMANKKYGACCGDKIVIEEYLEGFEISCLCFTDGESVKCMPIAQDHKRLLEGNEGPNTGGMGAYCPCPLVDLPTQTKLEEIMQQAVTAMRNEGCPFTGVLFGGFMVTSDGPKVLEFNCRFGDPETEAILPLLTSDLYEIMDSCCTKRLHEQTVNFDITKSSIAQVLVSGGYPEKHEKLLPITGIDKVPDDVVVFHAGTTLGSENQILTNGGRVLVLVSVKLSLEEASKAVLSAAANINYQGKFYRTDIGKSALMSRQNRAGLSYTDSGVNIDAGDSLVDRIKPLCSITDRPGCVGGLGMFGSVFDLKLTEFKDPLLVSGTDGVGTKLLVALSCRSHATIGQDLVAMCVNDILCHGAQPLFFLDYYATGKLNVEVAKDVIAGIAKACKMAGCALVGGETAEMPGMYPDGKYDLAGFAVGAVERQNYLPNIERITSGDVLIGLPSSGIHSNGYSLVRMIVERSGISYEDVCPFDTSKTLGEALLVPTRIYVEDVRASLNSGYVKAISHITGGGLLENIPRVLPSNLKVKLDAKSWNIAPVFRWLQMLGGVSDLEMCRTFNCGIGLALIVSSSVAPEVCQATGGSVIGVVCPRLVDEHQVEIDNLSEAFAQSWCSNNVTKFESQKISTAVLISGEGTNLQALIDSCQKSASFAKIVLVISNVANVNGLERARKAGIPTLVISHTAYPNRESFDDQLTIALESAGAHIICLAGFMRILSAKFVNRWKGQVINVHPSLLPSFKGAHAHKLALAAGVKVSGCTVHFVEEEIDSGEILEQEAAPVFKDDTVETLQARVKACEHKAYPRALQNLAKRFLNC